MKNSAKTAGSKLSSYEPGQIVRGIDLSAFRVTSKVAGPEGAVVKLANLQGEPVSLPANFTPVGLRMAHFASTMFFHRAFNKDFDLYVRAYCEQAGLPIPVGPNGKPFEWAKWFQSTVSPKLIVPGQKGEDAQAVKDEAIHEMLFTELSHRDILGKFQNAIKNFSKDIKGLPVENQLTVYLVKNFRGRVEEMNRKIKGGSPDEEVSMIQDGDDEEAFNILETEEVAQRQPSQFEQSDSERDISKFREQFYAWLKEHQSEKSAKWFIALFDIYWDWISDTSENVDDEGRPSFMPARRHLEPEWAERTGLTDASLYSYIGRLASLLEQFIRSNRQTLGEGNVFVKLIDGIHAQREALKKKKTKKPAPKQKAMPAHASLAALNLAVAEDQGMEPVTGGTPAMSMKELHDRMSHQASTGANCEIIEYKPGEWYYILENRGYEEDYEEPFDWRDNALAFGPFKSDEEAIKHLGDNHANPGGWSTDKYRERRPDPTLDKLIADAPKNTKFYSRSRWGSLNKTAKLIRGDELTPEMLQQVKDAFIYRWTSDNPRRTQVYRCDQCDIKNPYVNPSSAEGHSHPTIPLQTDDEWIREHAFYFTNGGKLMDNRSAEPSYLAKQEPQQSLPLQAASDTFDCCGGFKPRHKEGCPVYEKNFDDTMGMLKALPKRSAEEGELEGAVENILEARSDDMLTSEDWKILMEAVMVSAVGREMGRDDHEIVQNARALLSAATNLVEAKKNQMVTSEEWEALQKAFQQATGKFVEWRKPDELNGEEWEQNFGEKESAEPLQQLRPDITPGDTGRLPHATKEGSDMADEKMKELLQRAADKLQDYCAEANGDMNDSLAMEIEGYLTGNPNHPFPAKQGAGPVTPQQMQTQNVQKSQGVEPPAPTPQEQSVQTDNPMFAIAPESGSGDNVPMKKTVPPELPNQNFHMGGYNDRYMTPQQMMQEHFRPRTDREIEQEERDREPIPEATKLRRGLGDPAVRRHEGSEEKTAMLKTEQNTPEMEQEIEQLIATHPLTEVHQGCTPVFEHGQWWVTCGPCGAIFSVVDAEGGMSSNGLDLEEVESGDESCMQSFTASADKTAAGDEIFADKKRFFDSVKHKHHVK